MGVVSCRKHLEKHCTFDPGSPFAWMAFFSRCLVPRRCRLLIADTWRAGQLMATGSAPLNNGRLRHNHPQRGEDSLWPRHLPFFIHKHREMKGKTDKERKTERGWDGKMEQITIWTQRPKRDREWSRARIVSAFLSCLTIVDRAKAANQRCVEKKTHWLHNNSSINYWATIWLLKPVKPKTNIQFGVGIL